MADQNTASPAETTRLADCASRAVGVSDEDREWYVALVGNNTEKVSASKLEAQGYEVYLPVQKDISIWKDGRKKERERILLPGLLPIRLTKQERLEVVTTPWVKRFMMDRASGEKLPLAIIPNDQIERLKFMLGQSDTPVSIEQRRLRVGDQIRIIRGSLQGLTGNVYQSQEGKQYIVVRLDFLGCATAEVSPLDVEKVKNE